MLNPALLGLGLKPATFQFFLTHYPDQILARVASEDRQGYGCLTAEGPLRVRLPGRLRHAALDRRELPAVGDWLAVSGAGADADAAVVAVLPRHTELVRQSAGRATSPQVLAANVDVVFVVTAANADFSANRLARYRSAIASAGAEPVIIINKCDLVDQKTLDWLVDAVPRGLHTVAVSALTGAGMDELTAELCEGVTVVVVGSSGVGKSTIANHLLGDERMATSGLRASDDTGKHTTTHRELIPLPSGAVLIDTPGIRELALWARPNARAVFEQGEVARAADDPVAALASRCRFNNCQHGTEPGCAVQAALEAGTLRESELATRRQLDRELAYQARRQDQHRSRDAERRRTKRIHRRTRANPKTAT